MKTLVDIIHNRAGHWVGDGFREAIEDFKAGRFGRMAAT